MAPPRTRSETPQSDHLNPSAAQLRRTNDVKDQDENQASSLLRNNGAPSSSSGPQQQANVPVPPTTPPQPIIHNVHGRNIDPELLTGFLLGTVDIITVVLHWLRTTSHPLHSPEVLAVSMIGIVATLVALWAVMMVLSSNFERRGLESRETVYTWLGCNYIVWIPWMSGSMFRWMSEGSAPDVEDGWLLIAAPLASGLVMRMYWRESEEGGVREGGHA